MTADQQKINTSSHLPSGLTLRALVLGLILSLLVGAVGPYLSLYIQGANASSYFTSQIALCVLFVLIVGCNGILGAMRRTWVLQKGELLVVFILTSLANSTHVLVQQWVPRGIQSFLLRPFRKQLAGADQSPHSPLARAA